MSVLMLQSFAGERRAPGCAAHQKAPRLTVARRPNEIADSLKTEHRVINIKRHHAHAVVRVRRRGGKPGAEAPGLIDAFLENLSLFVLAIEHELVGVLRRVELPDRRIDSDLTKHALHAESP